MTLEELNTHLQNDYSAMVERDYETAKKLNQNCGEPIYEYFIKGSKKRTYYKYIVWFFKNMDEERYDNDYKELFNHIKVNQDILFGIYWLLQLSSVNFLDTKELADGIHDWLILEQIA